MLDKKDGWFSRLRGESAESLRAELERMTQELDAQTELNAQYEADLQRHKAQITEQQADNELLRSLGGEAEAKAAQLKTALDELTNKHVAAISRLEAARRQLERDLVDACHEQATAAEAEKKARAELDEERKKTREVGERQQAALRHADKLREQEARPLKAKLHEAVEELNQARSQRDELARKLEALTRAQRDAEQAHECERAEWTARQDQLIGDAVRAKAALAALQEQLHTAHDELARYHSADNQVGEELLAAQEELKYSEMRIQQLEQTLTDEQEAEARTRIALDEERKSAEQALSDADDKVNALEAQLRREREERAPLAEQVRALEAQLADSGRVWNALIDRFWSAITRVLGEKATLAFSREIRAGARLHELDQTPSLETAAKEVSRALRQLSLCSSASLSAVSDGLTLAVQPRQAHGGEEAPPAWLSVVAVQLLEEALGRRLRTTATADQEGSLVVHTRYRDPGPGDDWAAELA